MVGSFENRFSGKTDLHPVVPTSRKLAFLHLANDIIQNSKRKGEEYVNAFQKGLPEALSICVKQVPQEIISKISRLISIWEERKLFSTQVVQELRSKIPSSKPSSAPKKTLPPAPAVYEAPFPIVKTIQKVQALEKKRLIQGGQMALQIDPNVTNKAVIKAAQDSGQTLDIITKVNAAIKTTTEYRATIQEEWQERENLIKDLKSQIAEQEAQQGQLKTLRQSIETIENEFLNTRKQLQG